jgi:hypothetical protein
VILGYVLIALAVSSIGFAVIMRGRIARESNAARQGQLLITTWAVAEAPALFGGVLTLLTGDWSCYFIGLVAMLVGMLLTPVRR